MGRHLSVSILYKARYIKRTVWRSVCPYGTCSDMAESDWATQRPYATAKLACRDRPRRGVLFSRRSRQERSVPRAVLSASAAALIAHQPGSLPSGITLDILPSGGRPGFAPRSRGFVRERSWLSGVPLSGRAQRWPALGIELEVPVRRASALVRVLPPRAGPAFLPAALEFHCSALRAPEGGERT